MRAKMYHEDYAPTGKTFEASNNYELYKLQLVKNHDGWVDNPAKLGINIWNEAAQPKVNETAALFKKGKIPVIDPPVEFLTPAELERVQHEAKGMRPGILAVFFRSCRNHWRKILALIIYAASRFFG